MEKTNEELKEQKKRAIQKVTERKLKQMNNVSFGNWGSNGD